MNFHDTKLGEPKGLSAIITPDQKTQPKSRVDDNEIRAQFIDALNTHRATGVENPFRAAEIAICRDNNIGMFETLRSILRGDEMTASFLIEGDAEQILSMLKPQEPTPSAKPAMQFSSYQGAPEPI